MSASERDARRAGEDAVGAGGGDASGGGGSGGPVAGDEAGRTGRQDRDRAILEIVDARAIRTQAELVDALAERGIEVTQATVSRDIRRLGLVKVQDADGASRYALPPPGDAPAGAARDALRGALREFATDTAVGGALLAVRTQVGAANAVAVAIDRARLPGVVATLAGDDTILVLTRNEEDRARVLDEIRRLLRE